MAAKKRKSEKAKKRTGKTEKAKSARRAVNIKVNVLSKNPKQSGKWIVTTDFPQGLGRKEREFENGRAAIDYYRRAVAEQIYDIVSLHDPSGKLIAVESPYESIKISPRVILANKNPKRRRSPRPADRLKRKYSGRRFVICAHTRGGKRFYETADRKFTSDRKKARVFPTFVGASKEAHKLLSRMPATVKSLNVEFAK